MTEVTPPLENTRFSANLTQYCLMTPRHFGKFVLEIDKCSFGIYLIHMIFVRGILKHTKLHPYGAGSPFVLIGLTLGIFLVSFILTWILKKIPGVKKIL